MRPPWRLDAARCGVLPPRHLCALPGAYSITFTRYTILLILGILQPCPLLTVRYRSYRVSQILGISYCLK
nr:MAG TPA: hypothetical protein [Caudoviricetes sp.]